MNWLKADDLPKSRRDEVLLGLASLIVGEKISQGAFRAVHEHAYNSRFVVKIELSDGSGGFFNNVLEWEVWHEVKDTKWRKWFAPCHFISDNGLVLIQSRCKPIKWEEIPDRIPRFFSDVNHRNWGMLKGKPVAFDYGFTNFVKVAIREGNRRPKK